MASTITFSGLSGLDTSSWVEALVSVKQSTITSIQNQITSKQSLLSIVNNLQSYFTSFESALQTVTSAKLYTQNTATSSNTNIVTATAKDTAARQSYSVLVEKLATATSAQSGYSDTETLNATMDTALSTLGLDTNGVITVNGVRSFSVDKDDTIRELIAKFSKVGVTATFDEKNAKFTVNADTISESGSGFNALEVLKLSDGTTTNKVDIQGYESGSIVYADGSTALSALDITLGDIKVNGTVESIDNTITDIDAFLSMINRNGGHAEINDGVITITGASLESVSGGSNILDKLGITDTGALTTYSTSGIKVETENSLKLDTALSNIGMNSSYSLKANGVTMTITGASTLQDINTAAGKNIFSVDENGVISLDNSEGYFNKADADNNAFLTALGITNDVTGESATSDALTYKTKATTSTTLAELTDASKATPSLITEAKTLSINGGTAVTYNTGDNLAKLETAVKAAGGTFEINDGQISISGVNLSGTLVTALGLADDGDRTILTGNSAVTYDITAAKNTTLEALGISDGTITVNGSAYSVDKTKTVESFLSDMITKGATKAEIDDDGYIVIEGATITDGTSNLSAALGLTTTGKGQTLTTGTLTYDIDKEAFMESSTAGLSSDITTSYDGFVNNPLDFGVADVTNMTKMSTVDSTTTLAAGNYSIASAADLQKLATMTNNGLISSGCTFVLQTDIGLGGIDNWTSIGTSSHAFQGTFDGNGHIVANLKTTNSGLFGYSNGTIKNVGVENADVNGTDVAGALVGTTTGRVDNCYSTGKVQSSGSDCGGLIGSAENTVSNCYSSCYVKNTTTGGAGGLVGRATSTITNSFATGDVYSYDSNAGGLVATTAGTINNCYATGNIEGNGNVGGLVGYTTASINNTYATGKITNDYDNGGGLVGYTTGTISNSYTTGDVEGCDYTGGLVGYSTNSITNCYETGNVSGDSYVGGLAGSATSISYSASLADSVTGSSSVGSFVGSGSVTNTGNQATLTVAGNITGATAMNKVSTSKTMEEMGFTDGATLNLLINGTDAYTLDFGKEDQVSDVLQALKSYDIDASITDGVLTATSATNTFTMYGALGTLLTKDAGAPTVIENQHKSKALTETKKITEDTTIKDLGFEDGANLSIAQDDEQHTITFAATDTLKDVKAALSTYGITATIDGDGKFSASSKDGEFKLYGALGSYLTQNSTSSTESSSYVSGTQEVTHNLEKTTKMSDLGYEDGVNLNLLLDDTTNYTLSFSANDTMQDVLTSLSVYGIAADIDGSHKFTSSSASHEYTLYGELGNYLTTGATPETLYTHYSSDAKTYTTADDLDVSKLSSTKLSDLVRYKGAGDASDPTSYDDISFTDGYINIIKDGTLQDIKIDVDENTTVGQLKTALSAYDIDLQITKDAGTGQSTLKLIGTGDTYAVDGTSDLASQLFTTKELDTGHTGYADLWVDSVSAGQTGLITEDTLLSRFDIIDSVTPANSKKAAGSIIYTNTAGDTGIINVTSTETVGSLIDKFQNAGINAVLENGVLKIDDTTNGFTIDASSTSKIVDTLHLSSKSDLRKYVSSSDTLTYTDDVSHSVANFIDKNTKLSTVNITSGLLSIYVGGSKTDVTVDSDEDFHSLFQKIAAAGVEVGFLGEDGSINETNNTGIIAIKSAAGTTLTIGSSTDKSNFATIASLSNSDSNYSKSERALYKVNGSSKITEANLFKDATGNKTITAGSFVLGDATITIDSNTTINELVSKINATSKTTHATAYWDSLSGSLKLQATSDCTGSSLIYIKDNSGCNFAQVMGFTNASGDLNTDNQTLGDNALLRINGTLVSSATNQVTEDISRIKGLTLNLKGLSNGETVTITVDQDTDSIYESVSDVVDSYNTLMAAFEKQVSSGGSLSKDSSLKYQFNKLKNMMTKSVSGITGNYKNLSSIGISTGAASGTNTSTDVTSLVIDKETFMSALTSSPDEVKNLLVSAQKDGKNNGIMAQAYNFAYNMLGTTGYFQVQTKSLNTDITNLTKKSSRLEDSLNTYRNQLTTKFSNMESIISKMQQAYSSILTSSSSS